VGEAKRIAVGVTIAEVDAASTNCAGWRPAGAPTMDTVEGLSMSNWRKQLEALRVRIEKRKVDESVATSRYELREAMLPQQSAFAQKIIREVLKPVLIDFVAILRGTPGNPVQHEYDRRAFGVNCELNAQRFVVNVYLLPDSMVRVAVFLIP
jgi:hypothetical protein